MSLRPHNLYTRRQRWGDYPTTVGKTIDPYVYKNDCLEWIGPISYTEDMSDLNKIIDNLPISAVDDFDVEVINGYEVHTGIRQFKIPTANVRFLVKKGNSKEVVASIRLNNHQINELIETLQSKLNDFQPT